MIFSRLMETPTNTSPVRTPAAPAWAKKKSCHSPICTFTSLSRRPEECKHRGRTGAPLRRLAFGEPLVSGNPGAKALINDANQTPTQANIGQHARRAAGEHSLVCGYF